MAVITSSTERNLPVAGRSLPTRHLALLAGLVAIALATRIWGSFIGLPHQYQPDERLKVEAARRIGSHGLPRDAVQPGFLTLSLFAVQRAADHVGAAVRRDASGEKHTPGATTSVPQQLWLARLWLDALSTMTVPIVYFTARALAGPAAGLTAAALLALNPLAIASANYVKEDTPVTLWLAATCLASLDLRHRRTRAAALVAGAMAGLAAGSKYVGIWGFALVLVALTAPAEQCGGAAPAVGKPSPARSRATGTSRLFVFAIVGFAATLLATTPVFLLDPAAAIRGLAFQGRYATTGHHDGISVPITETGGLLYLRSAILPSLGLPAFLAALVGLLALAREDRRRALLLAIGTFGLLLVIEILPAKPYPFFSRYAMPVIPGLCVLAGVGCVWITRRWTLAHRASKGFPVAVAVLALTWPAVQTFLFMAHMYPDTRAEASAWITQNVPEGSWVLSTPYGPPLPSGRFRSWRLNGDAAGARLLQRVRDNAVVVTSDLFTRRFSENPEDAPEKAEFFAALESDSEELARFARRGPRFGFYNPELSVRRPTPTDGPRAD